MSDGLSGPPGVICRLELCLSGIQKSSSGGCCSSSADLDGFLGSGGGDRHSGGKFGFIFGGAPGVSGLGFFQGIKKSSSAGGEGGLGSGNRAIKKSGGSSDSPSSSLASSSPKSSNDIGILPVLPILSGLGVSEGPGINSGVGGLGDWASPGYPCPFYGLGAGLTEIPSS